MGKIKGNKQGLVSQNDISGKKTEPLVTVQQLKDTWLFGVKVRDKETGEDYPEESYQTAIDTAIAMFETYLDISISHVRNFEEFKDYNLNDYQDWGFMMLNNYPVISVNKLEMVYFRDEDGQPVTVQEIPQSWLRLNNHDGTIRLVPNTRFPAKLQINQAGSFFPEILRANHLPHLWKITYDFGFEDGKIPVLLNQAIAMQAAIIVLITAGHLILGAGIAGSSISIDGISQSIHTTQSAENSGFSSTIKDITEKLYGKTKDDPFSIVKMLKTYYKGQDMHVF